MHNFFWLIPALLASLGACLGGWVLGWALAECIPQWINRVCQTHRAIRRLLLALHVALCALIAFTLWYLLNASWTTTTIPD